MVFYKNKNMKNWVVFAILGIILTSCGTRVPYTNTLKEKFDLGDEKRIKQVQFYTSNEIILNRSYNSDSKGTQDGGTLVMSSRSRQDRIIIPPSTKCVFEKFGDNGEIFIRFEYGEGKVLKFKQRQGTDKFYLDANWKNGSGKVVYGSRAYEAVSPSAYAYLVVQLKKLQQTYRTDRVVKGIDVE